MNRVRRFKRHLQSFLLTIKTVRSKSTKWILQKASHQQQRESPGPGLIQKPEVDVLHHNAHNSKQDLENPRTEENEALINISSNIEAEIIRVKRGDTKLAAIVLNQSMVIDWGAILTHKSKVKRYTRELRSIDATFTRLQEAKAKAMKDGDEYAAARQSSMKLADLISTEIIQRLRADIGDLDYKLGVLSGRKVKLVGKLTHAQNIIDISESNFETMIRCLLEEHNYLEDESSSDDGHSISELTFSPEIRSPLPIIPKIPSPTPTEIERRNSQQNIWDLSETVQILEGKLYDWSSYRTKRLESYLQSFEAGETSETQTIFDLRLLQESQVTTRKLIEAEAEYAKIEKHAREIGVFVDDGEKEEGFSECDNGGYTASHEEDVLYEGYLGWIYGWMEETPERDAEPDAVGMAKVELDEWDARVVEMNDSVSVKEVFWAVGRRRETIDGYRKACESREAFQGLEKRS